MRRKLHMILQSNVTLEPVDAFGDHYIEPVPVLQPEENAARRRRVEAIAAQCLRGNPPFILSASLRGPFGGGWKNPWAKEDAKQMPPPETGRAEVEETLDGHEHFGAQRLDDESRSSALGQSGMTEFFSADINQRSPRRTPIHNRTWLRRPTEPTGRRGPEDQHTGAHMSPTPTQRHHHGPMKPGPLRVASPKLSAPIPTISPPKQQTQQSHPSSWRSSDPASMVLTSSFKEMSNMPAGTIDHIQVAASQVVDGAVSPSSLNVPASMADGCATLAGITNAASNNAIHHPRESVQCAQTGGFPVLGTLESSTNSTMANMHNGVHEGATPGTINIRDANASIIEGMVSAKKLSQRAIDMCQPPSRNSIHQAAERCVSGTRTPAIKNSKKRKASGRSGRDIENHAYPAANCVPSATSIKPQKIGEPKSKKPRPVTFDSSPEVARRPRPDIYDIMGDEDLARARKESLGSGRQSNYSTQAAMMLAQMEFREGTFPSAASETSGSWLGQQDETPRPHIRDPSPTVTPFHVFNAEQEKELSPGNSPGVLPSTQELFDAASPFAFSTIKKKPARTQRSSLRFAVLSNDQTEERVDGEHGVHSPASSAGRIPLKERNSRVSFKSTSNGSEKSSQESPFQLTLPALLPSSRTVQLPDLDFHTSLDDIGLHGGLSFTDRYLQNLDGLI